MKKLYIILIVLITTILIGCGSSNTKQTDKVTKYFQYFAGSAPILTGTVDSEYLEMIKDEYSYIKIIDTNATYQSYISELEQSFPHGSRIFKMSEEYKQYFKSKQSDIIDFEKNRLFMIGVSGYAGNGFKEDIYLKSESEAKLLITKRPYDGIEPKSSFFIVFAYIINRDIKTLDLSDYVTHIIDLNNTIYY